MGKKWTYRVAIKSSGGSTLKGVKLIASGRGVKLKRTIGRIVAGKTKTVKV